MATPPSDVVKQSDFLNRLVLDQETMQEQGRVEVLWMYPQANRVLGFICKSGFLGARKTAFNLSQIQAMGDNTLLTQGEPDKTDATRVQKLESLIHFEVWTDAGERIGRITDCLFKLRSGVITRYLMVSDPWGGLANGVYLISPKTIKGFGNGRVLMSQEAVKTLNVYSEGIKQRLEEFREFLEDEYDQITYRLRSLIGRARSTTQRVHNRIEQLGDQTKEGVQTFSEDAKTKAVGFRERLRERTQSWIDQAQATGQQWTGQVKEQTQTLGENWGDRPQRDSAPTLNVDAEEIPASIFDDDDDAFDFPDEATAQSSTRKLDPATEPSNDTWKDMPAAATWTDAQDVDWTDDDDDSWLTEDAWCDDEERVSHSRSRTEIAASPIAAPEAEASTSTSSAAETIIVPPAESPPASVSTPASDWDDEWEDPSQPEPEREQSSTSPPSPNQPESPASSTPSSVVPNWVDDDDDDPWI
jgi:uncharacterized protein YrrD/ElaB/YqjD/DUF883 family membrane-anchored ribosome-binding protein